MACGGSSGSLVGTFVVQEDTMKRKASKKKLLPARPTAKQCERALSQIVKRGMKGEDHFVLFREFKSKCAKGTRK